MSNDVQMTAKHWAIQDLAIALMGEFGLTGWQFRWNRRKRQFGQCVFPGRVRPGRIELSWYFVNMGTHADIEDTIRHEIAHALAGPEANHGPLWVEKCKVTGANPQRCSDKPMPKGAWQAQCPSCQKEYDRHRKPKSMEGWYCTVCGPQKGPIRWASRLSRAKVS